MENTKNEVEDMLKKKNWISDIYFTNKWIKNLNHLRIILEKLDSLIPGRKMYKTKSSHKKLRSTWIYWKYNIVHDNLFL